MTTAVNDRIISHEGDGQTLAFDFDFPIEQASDLKVTFEVGETFTEKALGADYSVTIAGTGGTVTFPVAPTENTVIYIEGDTPVQQPTVYTTSDRFPSASHEGSMDRLTRATQELKQLAARTIRVPLSEAGVDLEPKANRANAALAFDQNGDLDYIARTDLDALGARIDAIDRLSEQSVLNDLQALSAIVTQIVALGNVADDVELLAGLQAQISALAAIDLAALEQALPDIAIVTDNILNFQRIVLEYSRRREDVAAMISDNIFNYASEGIGAVKSGDILLALEERQYYRVVASDATDFDVTTAGGVRLQVMPAVSGFYDVIALGRAHTQADLDRWCQRAYNRNEPFEAEFEANVLVDPAGDATANTNTARGDVLRNAFSWWSKCRGVKPVMQFASGLHDVDTTFFVPKGERLKLESRITHPSISITAIQYSGFSGNTVTVTVTLASALPAHVVPGFVLGMSNLVGDNDINVAQGALTVATISPDRLTFTASTYARVNPVSPTAVITGQIANGLPTSQCIINDATVRFDTSAPEWDGFAQEGALNIEFGATLETANVSFGYIGAAGSAHDLIFLRNGNLNVTNYTCVCGAGDAVLRAAGSSSTMFLNRLLISGLGATEVLRIQDAATVFGTRCFMSGGTSFLLSIGDRSQIQMTSSVLANSPIITYAIGEFCAATIATSIISNAGRGLYAVGVQSVISIDQSVTFRNNDTAIDLTDGTVDAREGTPVFENNTITSRAKNNATYLGGAYRTKSQTQPTLYGKTELVIPNNQARTLGIEGVSGTIEFVSHSGAPGAAFKIHVRMTTNTGAQMQPEPDRAVINGTGFVKPLTGSLTGTSGASGDLSWSIVSGLLNIENRTGGTIRGTVLLAGDIREV